MARAIWTGSLSFGLVNVPVGLYSATVDKSPHFNQFERGTSDRIRYRRVNERTGDEVDYADIVKGARVAGDQYVVVTPEELESIAPGRSRTIDISDFVDAAEIDPIFYQKTYYLAPNAEDAARAYGLLREAMARADKVGIATFVMRNKEHLAAIRPEQNVLALETMFFADEIRDPVGEIGSLPVRAETRARELDAAIQLIESMTTPWRPELYTDTYRERVDELIEAKRTGEEVVEEAGPPERTKVVDLMDALQASVERGRRRRAGTDGDGAAPAGDGDDLAAMSKKELGELASRLNVSGRSKMDRAELEEAVRQARGDPSASASGRTGRKAS